MFIIEIGYCLTYRTSLTYQSTFTWYHCCYLVAKSCLTPLWWTVASQAPLSMGFPRQEYWSGLPFLFPEDLSDPEIEPASPALQVDSYYWATGYHTTWQIQYENLYSISPIGICTVNFIYFASIHFSLHNILLFFALNKKLYFRET